MGERRRFPLSTVVCLRRLLVVFLLVPGESGAQAIYKNEKFGYTFRNAKYGYTLSYPDHWSPSGNTYSNAFEIRNHDAHAPETVAEKNRASIIVVDTINENAAATETFLNGLDATPTSSIEHLRVDTHRAVRVIDRVPAQPIAPGTARSQPSSPQDPGDGDTKFYLSIDLYIANGKHLISVAARVPAEADTTVVEDILQIENSIKFQNRKLDR